MSTNIAALDQTEPDVSNVLDFTANFFRALGKAGVSVKDFRLPVQNRVARRNLAEFLKAGCPKVVTTNGQNTETLVGYELAATILGKDFVTPEEIASARVGVVYTEDQLEQFESSLPSREELEWLRDNGYMLIAGPPKEMSLLDIRDLNNEYFYSKTEGWYSAEKEKFSRDDKATTKWLKLRKREVPNSTNKTWDEQQPLLLEVEHVPNVAEVVWGVTSYKAVRGVYLLPNVYVRTSSLGSGGDRVGVGYFAAKGLRVGNGWGSSRDDSLGLASARNCN